MSLFEFVVSRGRRIKCGERHFIQTLGVDYKVVTTANELPLARCTSSARKSTLPVAGSPCAPRGTRNNRSPACYTCGVTFSLMSSPSVYFSFHYGGDVWRARIVRKAGAIDERVQGGCVDASLWEEFEL